MYRVLLLIFLIAPGLAADKDWNRLRADGLEVLTSGPAASAERVFQRCRTTMEALQSVWPLNPSPLTVYVVSGDYDVLPARAPGHQDGLYQFDGVRHYVMVRASSRDSDRVVAHEVTHFWLQQVFGRLPIWLNEGLAEYFSTVRRRRHDFEIGEPVDTHVQILRMYGNWRQAKPQEAEGVRLYPESWAIVSFLMSRSGDWRTVPRGSDVDAALMEITGKTLKEAREEFVHFVEADRYRLRTVAGPAVGHAVPSHDVVREPLVLREMLLATNGAKSPAASNKWYELAMEAQERGDVAAQRENLEKALSRPDAQVLFALGTLLWRQGETKRAVDVLAQASLLEPERFAIWETLALAASQAHDRSKALDAAARAHGTARGEADMRRAAALRLLIESPSSERRAERPRPVVDLRAAPEVLEGSLVQVDCLGERARLVILHGEKRVRLLIRDASAVASLGFRELPCGDAVSESVRVEYKPREDSTYLTKGDVVGFQVR